MMLTRTSVNFLRPCRSLCFTKIGNFYSNTISHEGREIKTSIAVVMGANPSAFTDKDVKISLEYLFPTCLTDRVARPGLKNYTQYDQKFDGVLDRHNRPHNAEFYTGYPSFYHLKSKLYSTLTELLCVDVPTDDKTVQNFKWIKKTNLEKLLGEEILDNQYEEVIALLNRIATFRLNNDQIEYLKQGQTLSSTSSKKRIVENDEESSAVGKRKTSFAEISIKKGVGKIIINSKHLLEYFPRLEDRKQVLFPMFVTGCLGKFDVSANVKGGGLTGQSGAIRIGLSKALACHSEVPIDDLIAQRLLISDYRKVERKKPGQKKARKKFTWVKR